MAQDSPAAVLVDAAGNPLTASTMGTPATPILSAQVPDAVVTGALNAANAAVTVPVTGRGVGLQMAAGSLIASTIVAEISFDGGTTWNATYFDDLATASKYLTFGFGSANPATAKSIGIADGVSHARIRVAAYTSGTATVTLRSSQALDPSSTYATAPSTFAPPEMAVIGGTDGTGLARPVATDTGGHCLVLAPDTTATGTLAALNAAVTMTLQGAASVGMQLAAGTLIGTLVAEVSYDGGTTWAPTLFDDPSTSNKTASVVFSSSNAATAKTLVGVGGAGWVRVRVSAYTSGTASVSLRGSTMHDPSVLYTAQPGQALPGDVAAVGGVDPGALLRALSVDTTGRLNVNAYPQDSYKATYAAAAVFTPTSSAPTDILTITGSSSKLVRVLRWRITATQTTAGVVNWTLLKRSTANSGGTVAAQTATPYSSSFAAATAVVQGYTANPTTGTLVGSVRARKAYIGTTGTAIVQDETIWEFGADADSAVLLRSASEVLALNLGGTALSGLALSSIIEWSEE